MFIQRASCSLFEQQLECHVTFQNKPRSTASLAMTGSFFPSPLSFLETGIGKDSMHLHRVPLCLSARAACGGVPFTDSHSVSSGLCYRVITDANAARETCCQRERGATQRGVALPVRGGHCSQEAVHVQCGDMAPPAFGEPPESTTLPTTKECEASSIWEREQRREEAVRITSQKRISIQENIYLI